jgi:branched-chain amino acid transport system substrate-binding protein
VLLHVWGTGKIVQLFPSFVVVTEELFSGLTHFPAAAPAIPDEQADPGQRRGNMIHRERPKPRSPTLAETAEGCGFISVCLGSSDFLRHLKIQWASRPVWVRPHLRHGSPASASSSDLLACLIAPILPVLRESDDRAMEVSILRRYALLGLLAGLVGVLALVAAGCGGSDESSSGGGNVTALPASSCAPLEYKGEGDPDMLIATDFPMQGASRTQTLQIVGATRLLLEQQDWKAGDQKVALQVCDDATAQAAKWDPDKCSRNAHAYAQNESLIGVIGTFNSGCAAIEIPVLNQAPGGGLLLLSPANTYGCLTEPCAGNEPEKYYPSGTRNYARVAPSDPNQGAVMAEFAKAQGVSRIYILNDKEAYGLGVAKNFQGAAEALGMTVTGFSAYDPKQANFRAIFTRIKATNPDGVFIGGLVDENSGQLINDKVSVLGPNAGNVKLFLPDGFTADAVFQRSEGGTPNAKDAFFSVAGVGIDKYTGEAKTFIDDFKKTIPGKSVDPYAILGAQAARVMLDAIADSDGTRADVIKKVFETKIDNGLIGSFEINENGDITGAKGAALLFTIYKGTDKLVTFKTAAPKGNLVEAARQAAAG